MERQKSQDRLLLPRDVSVGFDIATFLNEEGGQTGRQEALKVFELCRELDTLRRERDAISTAAELNKNTVQTGSALARLNALLGAFQFTPALWGFGSYSTFWKGKGSAGVEPGTITSASIVKQMLEMTEAGTLDRVRQCICGRWFLAQTNKKQVCSDACRFRKFKQDNLDFNDHRADYMREYRQNLKVKARRRKTRGK